MRVPSQTCGRFVKISVVTFLVIGEMWCSARRVVRSVLETNNQMTVTSEGKHGLAKHNQVNMSLNSTRSGDKEELEQYQFAYLPHSAITLEPWMQDQWADRALGKHLVETVHNLGYTTKLAEMRDAYKAPPERNLDMMKKATGNIVQTNDINYIWTSLGRMALMLEESRADPEKKPLPKATYDDKLRAWVMDLETLYEELMAMLQEKLDAAKTEEDKEQIAHEIKKFDKRTTCDQGDWANGIAVRPTPQFRIVSKWVNKYFPDELNLANKLFFYRPPGTAAPPFVQMKVHRTCFFFKGREPGTVTVNPELAKAGTNELRDNLELSVYSSQQFTVEVIDKGKAGKLTLLNDRLYVLPMSPTQVDKFDPQAADAESDAQNAYLAFKNSHPDTIHHDSLQRSDSRFQDSLGASISLNDSTSTDRIAEVFGSLDPNVRDQLSKVVMKSSSQDIHLDTMPTTNLQEHAQSLESTLRSSDIEPMPHNGFQKALEGFCANFEDQTEVSGESRECDLESV